MFRGPGILNCVSRNQPVTEYVRMRLREWKNSGRELQEVAQRGGMSKSHPSQVLSGTFGVGGKTIGEYAKAFDLDEPELVKLAHDWWKKEGSATAKAAEEATPLGEAIALLAGLGQGSEAELRAIAYAFKHERFDDRDAKWWQRMLLLELEHDREKELLARAAKKEAQREKRLVAEKHAQMQKQRAELEKAHARQHQAPKSTPAPVRVPKKHAS